MSENDIESEKEEEKHSDNLSPVPEAPSGSHHESSLSSNDKVIGKQSNGKGRVQRRKKQKKSFHNSSDQESGAN